MFNLYWTKFNFLDKLLFVVVALMLSIMAKLTCQIKNISEKLNELSALTKDQFEEEKEGAIAHEEPFATGLLETPEEMRKLSREDQEYLDRLDWDQ
jgi:hypothetical protein